MKENSIKFPIIAFNHNSMQAHRSYEDLTTCTNITLKNKWYDGLEIIDSNGAIFIVNDVKENASKSNRSWFNILATQKIKIEMFYSQSEESISLEDCKNRILNQLENVEKDFWEALDEDSLFKIKEQIKTSIDFAQLMSFMCLLYYAN